MAISPYHITSNGPRVNTLVIDLGTVPSKRINMDLIVRFVHQNLKIQFSTVQSLQHNTGKSLVFLECRSEDQALAAADINDGRHEITIENIKYAVTVHMEDGATTVRIHDVSPQSENTVIEQALQKYGDVIWLKEEEWTEPAILKGIKNGVRAVRIKMHTEIPSYINIRGEVTLVTYKNQQQTCRHCNRPVHWGRKCMEAGYMEMQLHSGKNGNISDRLKAAGVNYAEALASGGPSSQQPSTSTGAGNGVEPLSPNFTNLTQLVRLGQKSIASKIQVTPDVRPPVKTNTHTNTNITNNANAFSEIQPSSSVVVSKEITAEKTVSDQMDTSTQQPITETSAKAAGNSSIQPTIPLKNPYAVLISDDEMNENDKIRSRSGSPSHQKKRSRTRKTSK